MAELSIFSSYIEVNSFNRNASVDIQHVFKESHFY